MSVPSGTLTDGFRAELLEFYGRLFDWSEIESLRLPEHFGIVVASTDEAERLWKLLDADPRDVNLEPLATGDDGYRSFRFRYLLPLTVEVQFFP